MTIIAVPLRSLPRRRPIAPPVPRFRNVRTGTLKRLRDTDKLAHGVADDHRHAAARSASSRQRRHVLVRGARWRSRNRSCAAARSAGTCLGRGVAAAAGIDDVEHDARDRARPSTPITRASDVMVMAVAERRLLAELHRLAEAGSLADPKYLADDAEDRLSTRCSERLRPGRP